MAPRMKKCSLCHYERFIIVMSQCRSCTIDMCTRCSFTCDNGIMCFYCHWNTCVDCDVGSDSTENLDILEFQESQEESPPESPRYD